MRKVIVLILFVFMLIFLSLEVIAIDGVEGAITNCNDTSRKIIGDAWLESSVNCDHGYYFTAEGSWDPGAGITFDCQGNSITGANHANKGFYIDGDSDITIKNCVIQGFDEGVYIINSASQISVEDNCTIRDNNEGIYISGSTYNSISDSTIESNVNYGIYLRSDSDDTTIDGCTIKENEEGIHLIGGSGYIISDNQINDNVNYGIYGTAVDNSEIKDNNLSKNPNAIYLSTSSSNKIESNSFSDYTWFALTLSDSDSNEITENVATGGIWSFIIGDDSNGNTLSKNKITESLANLLIADSNDNSMSNNWFCLSPVRDFSCDPLGTGPSTGNTGTGNFMDNYGNCSGDFPINTTIYTCYENLACNDGLDNDADELIDCADPDCDGLQYATDYICVNGVPTYLPYDAPEATVTTYEIPIVIDTYEDFLLALNQGEVISNIDNTCNDACNAIGQTCIFAEAGKNICSGSGSSICTCLDLP